MEHGDGLVHVIRLLNFIKQFMNVEFRHEKRQTMIAERLSKQTHWRGTHAMWIVCFNHLSVRQDDVICVVKWLRYLLIHSKWVRLNFKGGRLDSGSHFSDPRNGSMNFGRGSVNPRLAWNGTFSILKPPRPLYCYVYTVRTEIHKVATCQLTKFQIKLRTLQCKQYRPGRQFNLKFWLRWTINLHYLYSIGKWTNRRGLIW